MWDGGQLLCRTTFKQLKVDPLPWSTLYLHLEQSSAAGKPGRDIIFQRLIVRQLPTPGAITPNP